MPPKAPTKVQQQAIIDALNAKLESTQKKLEDLAALPQNPTQLQTATKSPKSSSKTDNRVLLQHIAQLSHSVTTLQKQQQQNYATPKKQLLYSSTPQKRFAYQNYLADPLYQSPDDDDNQVDDDDNQEEEEEEDLADDETTIDTTSSSLLSKPPAVPFKPVFSDDDDYTAAPLLATGAVNFRRGEPIPEHITRTLTGDSQRTWIFPSEHEKDGHLANLSYNPILQQLQSQASHGDPPHRTQYLQFAEEWPMLQQSILYNNLQASVLHQLLQSIQPDLSRLAEFPWGSSLVNSLRSLYHMDANLLSDQIKRSSTIIVAAAHGYQAAATMHSLQGPSAVSSHLPLEVQILMRNLKKKQASKLETNNMTSFSSNTQSKNAGNRGTTYFNNSSNNSGNQMKPVSTNYKGKNPQADFQSKRSKTQPQASSSKTASAAASLPNP